MTPWDVILQMQAALRADAGLEAWCQSTYGNGLFVSLGSWPGQSPGQELCPFVLLCPDTEDSGLERAEETFLISGLAGLHDKDVSESESGLDRVQLGQQRLSHEFLPLVLAALGRSLGPGLILSQVRVHDFSKAPVFEKGLDLTVKHSRAIGARRR